MSMDGMDPLVEAEQAGRNRKLWARLTKAAAAA